MKPDLHIRRQGNSIALASLLILAGALQSACRTEGQAVSGISKIEFPSDEEVMRKAYDNMYAVPDNFFVDEKIGRFSEIIEDESPLVKLISD